MRHRLIRISLVLVVLAALLILFASYRVNRPHADHPIVADGVRLQDVQFHSTALNREMQYRVFLPANPVVGRQYPVVYLLHGAGDDFRNWSDNSDVSKYAAEGLILVMPEGDLSYYVNAVETKSDRYEDYITRDLIADVESRFPAKTDRRNRAIVGISMGGFGALFYALARPELYSYAGAISPAVDAPRRSFNWVHVDKWLRFRKIFGPVNSDEQKRLDPYWIVQRVNPAASPYIYLTTGDKEAFTEPIERFSSSLKLRGFAYELHVKPGGHDWNEWNQQVPGCFAKLKEFVSAEQ